MRRASLLFVLLSCGPGPTEPNAPNVAPVSTTKVTPTKPIDMGPDCKMKAMDKLAATITDAGMRDASAESQDEVQPPDTTAVLQKLLPKLTACNPTQVEGCAYLTTSVEKDGSVSSVEPFVSDALSPEVIECLVGVLKEARFDPLPKAGKMQLPVTFSRTR